MKTRCISTHLSPDIHQKNEIFDVPYFSDVRFNHGLKNFTINKNRRSVYQYGFESHIKQFMYMIVCTECNDAVSFHG
jgi:hypothetical protein